MATDLFDPAKIDAAVGEAFGTNPTRPAQPPVQPPVTSQPAVQPAAPVTSQPTNRQPAVNLTGLDPNLSSALSRAQAEYRRRYGADLPITSGVRTRADQERLFREAQAGKPNVFMPLDPSKFPNQEMFHTDAIDIPTSVPESFLNEFGIHRPLGRRDPVHAVLMPQTAPTAARATTQAAPSTPGQLSVNDLMKPEAVDAAVSDVFNAPPAPTKAAKVTGSVADKVRSFLRGSAALADTLYGVVPGVAGMVTYAGARAAGQTPEQAGQTQARVTSAIERPVGKAFGVTETPEYKGEISQRAMEAVGKFVGETAESISKKTGIPVPEVEYYLNLGVTAPAGLRGTRAGAAISREAGYVADAAKAAAGKVVEGAAVVTPAPVRSAVRATTEAIAPGTTTPPVRPPTLGAPGQPAAPTAPQPQMGRGSVGAAGVPDATIIRQALTSATPEFQQLYGNMPLDKVNTPVVMRHLEADSLPIPVRLTEGQATGDVVKLSNEQNLKAKQPAFAQRFNEQNTQLVENVPLIRERAAPDVFATKTIESSQALIEAYKALDDARNVDIRAAYKALEDANGGAFPVDAQAIVRNADAKLAKKLKTNFVPPEIAADLKAFREGKPMNFEEFEALRTNLAAEGRKADRAGDGNRSMAVSLIREALEDVPLKGEAATLKPMADKARDLAKTRFDALKKDPAYKAAVDDAVPADKFFDKFVINGINKNINTMIETLGRDSVANQHMRAGTINWLSDKAGIVDGRGNFSQANYNKALKRLDDVNNFGAIFDPDSQLQLRTLGNVAAYTQFQPRGSFVNNSNTLVGFLATKAAGGLEQVGNLAGLKTIGYPIGSEVRRGMRSARERREVEAALQPGAGSTLQDISRQGKVPNIVNQPPAPRIEPTFDFTIPGGLTDLEVLNTPQYKRKRR